MAATERLVCACARYAQRERESFREISRSWLRDRRTSSWEARVVKSGFTKFWLTTLEDWTRLAADLLRRWKLPEHRGEVEDMRQELAIGALKALRRYAPHHGVDLPAFVVWNALAAAKKKLHKLRGAVLSGNSGKNPNRIEVVFGSLRVSTEREDSTVDAAVDALMYARGLVAPAPQEVTVDREERLEQVRGACENGVEEIVVEVTFEGFGLDEGARRLYEDPDMCLAYRVGCEPDARRLVGRAAAELTAWFEEELVA